MGNYPRSICIDKFSNDNLSTSISTGLKQTEIGLLEAIVRNELISICPLRVTQTRLKDSPRAFRPSKSDVTFHRMAPVLFSVESGRS